MQKSMMFAVALAATALLDHSASRANAAVHSMSTTQIVGNAPKVGAVTRAMSYVDPRYHSALTSGAVPVVYVSQLAPRHGIGVRDRHADGADRPIEVISGLANPQGLAVATLSTNLAPVKVCLAVVDPGAKTLTSVISPTYKLPRASNRPSCCKQR